MVAVGDHQFLIGHRFVDGGDALGLPDDPEAMDDVVFVGEFGGGGGFGFGLRENFVDDARGVAVEQEKLAGVRLGVAEEFEAVGFGAGERVLVAEDDAGGIFLELAGADKAAASKALVACPGTVYSWV